MAELDGLVYDLPEADYHARPELSSTEARLLLDAPARYREAKDHPRSESTVSFDVGSAVHSKVLGTGWDVVVVDADDWRSKAARAARDEARDAGRVPLLRKDAEMVDAMAESVLANRTARALLGQAGSAEVSVFAEVDNVRVRGRFDFLPDRGESRTVAVDLKTTASGSLAEFEKSVARYGYDVQAAWYLDAYRQVTGDGSAAFVFVVVEKSPPFLVSVFQLPLRWLEMGQVRAQEARRLFRECSAAGVWPGYPDEVQVLDPPTWEIFNFETRYSDE